MCGAMGNTSKIKAKILAIKNLYFHGAAWAASETLSQKNKKFVF
jgi:hypothetical protein